MPSGSENQVDAGYQAMAAGEWSTARDAFSAVLETAELPEVLLARGNACYWLGDLAEVIDSFERAYASARRASQPQLAAGAALALVGYHKQFVGNMTAARGWLSRAARIVETDAPEMRGDLCGATAFVTDDPVESERWAREAVAIGRSTGRADLEVLALTAVGNALVQQGRTAEGMAVLDEAMAEAIGGDAADPLIVAHTSCMTMLVCSAHFDIERATQWLRAMDRFVARYGCPFLDAECRTNYGRVLFENGDWPAAERFLESAVELSKDAVPTAHALAAGTLAELRLAQGRIEDAARALHGVEGRDEAVAVVASLHLARNDPALAAAVLQRRLDAMDAERLDAASLIDLLGQAELALGRDGPATDRARRLVALGDRHDCPLIVAHGNRLLGHALTATDAAAARRHLEMVLAAFARAEIPYRAALTRLRLAALVRESDPALAVLEARVALTALEDLGAGREADEAAALLRGMGVKAARSGPRNVGRLTKREQEVLALLGEGCSNPEIAERLFVSRKTVEHHVARVLAKLGLRSRTEAAALVAGTR